VLESKAAIIGYNGHALVVAESYCSINKNLKYYTEVKEITKNPFNLKYLGLETGINFQGWDMNISFILGIGDNQIREKVAKLVLKNLKHIETVLDPNAIISKTSEIGIGVFVSKGVLVNTLSKVGDFTILNTGCIIEHECEIGQASHIAPGAVLTGNVKVGNRTFIGANAVIKQGIVIGDYVIIGAGSVILKNVENNSKIVGNPSRLI
jgi:acetyltransferase EpsM